jgi:cation diffusion facilitator family transporter
VTTETTTPRSSDQHRLRLRAGRLSLLLAVAVLALKLAGWWFTGSVAILSDALESVVNVASAGFLMFTLYLAAQPPDQNHPYGHGKVEYFSSALEGMLVLAAAVSILVSAGFALWRGSAPHDLGQGMLLTGFATLLNFVLGRHLIAVGRRTQSPALVSDGVHVMSDVMTSVAVLIGVGLVYLTGWGPLDPIVAIVAGLVIGWTGLQLIRGAVAGLMNQVDEKALGHVVEALRGDGDPAAIHVHNLRAWTAGAEVNVDFHLAVPEYWSVARAHALGDRLADRVRKAFPGPCDVIVHLDPCEPHLCRFCRMPECSLRSAPFEAPPRQDLAGMRGVAL